MAYRNVKNEILYCTSVTVVAKGLTDLDLNVNLINRESLYLVLFTDDGLLIRDKNTTRCWWYPADLVMTLQFTLRDGEGLENGSDSEEGRGKTADLFGTDSNHT